MTRVAWATPWQSGLLRGLVAVVIALGLDASARGQALDVPARPAMKDVEPPGSADGDRVGPSTAIAQRAVLYEEDPTDAQGRRFVGSTIWRSETVTAGADVAVKADLEIPERRLTMSFSLYRNSDRALPASHVIEVAFKLPPDFPFDGVSNVPGVLMKQTEQTRGAPLAGLSVKVTTGVFMIGLSAVEADVQRNLQLLKERAWFDIPIYYGNGRRAILALEKGDSGERAFDEAFRSWGQ